MQFNNCGNFIAANLPFFFFSKLIKKKLGKKKYLMKFFFFLLFIIVNFFKVIKLLILFKFIKIGRFAGQTHHCASFDSFNLKVMIVTGKLHTYSTITWMLNTLLVLNPSISISLEKKFDWPQKPFFLHHILFSEEYYISYDP